MTKRQAATAAPQPLEAYAQHWEAVFGKRNQREEVRRQLEGVLLPRERTTTLAGLANTEAVVGAQQPRAQALQQLLSEAAWDERAVQQSRLRLWLQEPSTAPSEQGVLLIDEQGDRQAGHTPAHIGRPDLANWGKLDQGVVSLTSLWAEERVYDPLDFERYTPAQHFEKGQQDPRFRSQLTSAGARLRRAVQAHIALRAVVAEACQGADRGVKRGWRDWPVGDVLALKPSPACWPPAAALGSLHEAAQAAGWERAAQPGTWVKLERTLRHGSKQHWWALAVVTGPSGPDTPARVVLAPTEPQGWPALRTLSLVTHLPAPLQRGLQLLGWRWRVWKKGCDGLACAGGSNKAPTR